MLDFLKSVLTGKVTNQVPSQSGELNTTDWKKIGVHAVIVGVSAGVTVLINNLAGLNLGEYTVVVVPVVSSILISIQKWLVKQDTVTTVEEEKK